MPWTRGPRLAHVAQLVPETPESLKAALGQIGAAEACEIPSLSCRSAAARAAGDPRFVLASRRSLRLARVRRGDLDLLGLGSPRLLGSWHARSLGNEGPPLLCHPCPCQTLRGKIPCSPPKPQMKILLLAKPRRPCRCRPGDSILCIGAGATRPLFCHSPERSRRNAADTDLLSNSAVGLQISSPFVSLRVSRGPSVRICPRFFEVRWSF